MNSVAPGVNVEAATAFFASIRELAEAHANPVLLILDGVERLEQERRYPEGGLSLMEDQWRCFYHCHDAPQKPGDEHGHFHFFAACEIEGARAWSHVAALSMDHEGQPLRWFTVNRWVSDGPWLSAPQLAAVLRWRGEGEGMPLLQRWLSGVLRFYADALLELLAQRDHILTGIKPDMAPADKLEDRGIYLLSERPVDLQADLTVAWEDLHQGVD